MLCTKRTLQYESSNGEQITRIYEYEYAGTQLLRWGYTTSGYAEDINHTYTFTNIYEGNLVTSQTMIIDYS